MKIDERRSRQIDNLSCNKARAALKILMLGTDKSHPDIVDAIESADIYTSTDTISYFLNTGLTSSELKKWELFLVNSRVAAFAVGLGKEQWSEYVEETMHVCDISKGIGITVNEIIDDMEKYKESVGER